MKRQLQALFCMISVLGSVDNSNGINDGQASHDVKPRPIQDEEQHHGTD
jgi:hypothetical protein